MKKIFLFFAVAIFSLPTIAQDTLQDSGEVWTYAELVGTRKFLSNKVNVEIDYGQENPLWKFTDDRIVDPKTGKAKSFNSMVDAMNFMGALGWEFVQAFVVTEGNQNVYHWLLKLRVQKDEEGNFIPATKESIKNTKKE